MTTLDDLKPQARWVCYDSQKKPVSPLTGKAASSTDARTWGTYAQAKALRERMKLAGVGIVLNGDGIVGIDLDKCIDYVDENENIVLKMFARHLYGLASSYAEVSPSGKGIHILGTATIAKSLKKQMRNIGVEVYETSRYFTVTEDVISETTELRSVQDIVDAVFDEAAAMDAPPIVHELPTLPNTTITDERWVRLIVEKRIEAAVRMVREAVAGERHNKRYAAGRLLGGYLAAGERHGVRLLTTAEAIQKLYDAQPPSPSSAVKERRAIEQGIISGRMDEIEIPNKPQQIEHAKKSPVAGSGATETAKRYVLSDIGNGERLRDAAGDRLRYVEEWKQWLWWDGRRWERTTVLQVKELAHQVIRGMLRSAADGEATDTDLAKWALKSEASARVDAMIEEGKPYLRAKPEQFDRNPDLLTVANGTVDMRTMQLRAHDPADMITKLVDVPLVETGLSTRWADFLRVVFCGDDDLISYVQRAVGYSLTGHTSEHCLFFCYGDGANGKSTFMRALEIVSGEYTTTAQIDALLDHKGGGEAASPNIAGLFGKRIAMAQEMPEGGRFDESRVKTITGGDTITARHLYGKLFEFRPTHTLWVTGNHKPKITGTDAGIWRRLRIVPFVASISAAQRRDSREFEGIFQEDKSAILEWVLLGAYLWYQNGLGESQAVTQATTAYRGEEDIIARFVQTMCVVGPGKRVGQADLYAAWKQWAEDEGERAAAFKSQRWLVYNLTFRKLAVAQNRYVEGIGLVDHVRSNSYDEDAVSKPKGAIRRGE